MATWCINPLEPLLLLVPLPTLIYFYVTYQKEVFDSNLDSKTSKMPGCTLPHKPALPQACCCWFLENSHMLNQGLWQLVSVALQEWDGRLRP